MKYLEKVTVFTKVIVINQQGKILSLKRSKKDTRRPGCWDFPGGNIEPNEHIIDAARREVIEESGLVVEDLRPIYIDSSKGLSAEGIYTVAVAFIAYGYSGMMTLSNEHSTYQWVDPKGFLALDTGNDGGFLHSAVRAYLDQLREESTTA